MVIPRNFLIGQFNTELLLRSSGVTGLYGVRFHAWGLYPILKTPMRTYTNRLTDSLTIGCGTFKEIEGNLLQRNEHGKIASLEDLFVKSIGKINHHSVIEPVAREIYERDGIADLVIAGVLGVMMSSVAISEYPLVVIPTMRVPLAYVLHLHSLRRLRQQK